MCYCLFSNRRGQSDTDTVAEYNQTRRMETRHKIRHDFAIVGWITRLPVVIIIYVHRIIVMENVPNLYSMCVIFPSLALDKWWSILTIDDSFVAKWVVWKEVVNNLAP